MTIVGNGVILSMVYIGCIIGGATTLLAVNLVKQKIQIKKIYNSVPNKLKIIDNGTPDVLVEYAKKNNIRNRFKASLSNDTNFEKIESKKINNFNLTSERTLLQNNNVYPNEQNSVKKLVKTKNNLYKN